MKLEERRIKLQSLAIFTNYPTIEDERRILGEGNRFEQKAEVQPINDRWAGTKAC